MSDTFDQLANLGVEADKTVGQSMEERLASLGAPPTVATPVPPKRGRGRPPGSPNKPKPEGSEPPGKPSLVIPGTRGRPPVDKTPEQIAKALKDKADHKKARATEFESTILQEFNEQLMGIFMMMGVPASVLYKEGQAPKAAPINNPYSDVGNMLAIGPMQAKSWARFAAELEATDSGTKVVGNLTGDSKAPLIISGVMSLATGIMYARQLSDTFDKMKPMIEAYQKYQKAQQTTTEEDGNG